MKQFHFEYKNINNYNRELSKIKRYTKTAPYSRIVFQIYTKLAYECIKGILDAIDIEFPDALYYGCQTFGNIINGEGSSDDTLIVCTVYEYATTQVEMIRLDSNPCITDVDGHDLSVVKPYCLENTWVKALEVLSSVMAVGDMFPVNRAVDIPEHIQIFGGVSCHSSDISNEHVFVFSKGHAPSETAVVILALGGKDLYINSTYVVGWKPLGKQLTLDECEGTILKKLDNEPAFNIYRKYLKISNDDSFGYNALVFPLLIEENGIYCLRCPLAAFDDGSLMMSSNLKTGSRVRMAYGDPTTIVESVWEELRSISKFSPDVIRIYSCAARKTFWGDNASMETQPFEIVAPATGLYTHGEIFRYKQYVFKFNCTLVVASLREGEKVDLNIDEHDIQSEQGNQMPLVRRIVNFIGEATQELEEAYNKLEELSITDTLSKLFNRGETQRRIDNAVSSTTFQLIMMDIDNFKRINDTYGHDEGDKVIVKLAEIIDRVATQHEGAFAGRWGGEEFMLGVPNSTREEAIKMAEEIRTSIAKEVFTHDEKVTISLGLTSPDLNEHPERVCKRVDEALYESKQTGKNKLTVK